MSVIRVGSTSKYAEGWAAIFGSGASKKTKPKAKNAVRKPAGKKAKSAKKRR